MRSITIGEIATNLNTSRNTVSKVLNSRGYVSDALKKRIVIEAVEKGYKNISDELMEYYRSLGDTSRPETYTIAVLASCPETSPYWTQVIAGISNEINTTEHRLFYHFMNPEEEREFTLPPLFSQNQIDGVILINIYHPEVIAQIAELPMAKVYLDLPLATTQDDRYNRQNVRGDVILPESHSAISQITDRCIAKRHCSALGFVGNISCSLSVYERYQGFRNSLEKRGVPFRSELCLLSSRNPRFFYEDELAAFLDSLPELPQAFICSNDLTAYLLHQKLKERFPDQAESVFISGYDNLPPTGISKPYLTSVDINTSILGRKLVNQLFWRLASPEFPYEVIHLSTKVLFR